MKWQLATAGRSWLRVICFPIVVLGCLASAGNAQYFFHQLSGFGTSGSYPGAAGISGNGLTVVGDALFGTTVHGIRWHSPAWATEDQGILVDGQSSHTRAANFDGSATTGQVGSGPSHAYRWTSSGMVDLGVLSGGTSSVGNAINSDGSVIVGNANDSSGQHAFRWTSATGMIDIGTPFGASSVGATGVSGDGSKVVGTATVGGIGHAFLFDYGSSNFSDLGTLGGGSSAQASAMSANGSVVVGTADVGGGLSHAFRWTSGVGMQDLGGFGLYSSFVATACSADGSVIVGNAFGSGTTEFVWTQASGMMDLPNYLQGQGASFAATQITSVSSVSADGLTFAGSGTGPLGLHPSAWVAYTTAPEPASMIFLGAGLALVLKRGKKNPAGR